MLATTKDEHMSMQRTLVGNIAVVSSEREVKRALKADCDADRALKPWHLKALRHDRIERLQ